MRNSRSISALFQNVCTGRFRNLSRTSSAQASSRLEALPVNLGGSPSYSRLASLEGELWARDPAQCKSACIYMVPARIREVEPQAFTPKVVSIGPYHYRSPRLQEMERFKRKFFRRLFDPRRGNRIHLDPVLCALEAMEQEARSHYSEESELDGDEFVEMMLIDGCFIVELLRELEKYNFKHGSPLIERWMLPNLRRDLIMLENQLPMPVLEELFHLTSNNSLELESKASLQELAIRFFAPLLHRNYILEGREKINHKGNHFLDLFRATILPETATDVQVEKEWDVDISDPGLNARKNSEILHGAAIGGETHMKKDPTKEIQKNLSVDWSGTFETEEANRMRSTRQLIKAGMYIEKGQNRRPLEVDYGDKVLIIPPLFIDDYKGTLFRNLLAYEQRHHACKPHVTAYLFFLDGLINSAEDVELLHCREIIHHSLGSDKDVAELVNRICKGVARETKDSYLHKVVCDSNLYLNSVYATIVAPIVHRRLGKPVAAIPFIFSFVASVCHLIMGDGDAFPPDF